MIRMFFDFLMDKGSKYDEIISPQGVLLLDLLDAKGSILVEEGQKFYAAIHILDDGQGNCKENVYIMTAEGTQVLWIPAGQSLRMIIPTAKRKNPVGLVRGIFNRFLSEQ